MDDEGPSVLMERKDHFYAQRFRTKFVHRVGQVTAIFDPGMIDCQSTKERIKTSTSMDLRFFAQQVRMSLDY